MNSTLMVYSRVTAYAVCWQASAFQLLLMELGSLLAYRDRTLVYSLYIFFINRADLALRKRLSVPNFAAQKRGVVAGTGPLVAILRAISTLTVLNYPDLWWCHTEFSPCCLSQGAVKKLRSVRVPYRPYLLYPSNSLKTLICALLLALSAIPCPLLSTISLSTPLSNNATAIP